MTNDVVGVSINLAGETNKGKIVSIVITAMRVLHENAAVKFNGRRRFNMSVDMAGDGDRIDVRLSPRMSRREAMAEIKRRTRGTD